MPDGRRTLYNGIWSELVPPKVRIFACQLSKEGLAIQCNRKQRTLKNKATCQICGARDENDHHAVVR
jgi:transcription elongation factor Elf1